MELTGNPFVDTGLMTLAVTAGKESVEGLDFEAIATVFGNGDQLARQNQSLKCFTMVFGTNGPLTQPAYKKSAKNEEIYKSILYELLSAAKIEGRSGPRCDLTGRPTNLNFHAICAKVLSKAGVPVPDRKWLGRDWIPLGGSLGNDAQSLPVASRPLRVSALALIALQYLPLGVYLYKGKLSCYQSTDEKLSFASVENIVERNRERLAVGQAEILGKGMGTAGALELLMNCFETI